MPVGQIPGAAPGPRTAGELADQTGVLEQWQIDVAELVGVGGESAPV